MSKLKHSISLAFIAVLAGACGSKAPVINSFTSSPATSLAGDPVTLSWDVSGATTLTIDKGVGDVSSKKSIVVTPQSTLTFTLTATSDGGSVTKTLTQTVKPKTPPTRVLSFTASPVQIAPGASSTLAWQVTGTPTVTITPGVTVPSAATSVPVSPTSTTTYTLSAIAPTDSAAVTSTVTVIVTPAPAITSFAAKAGESATDHPRGSALDLVWVSTGDRFLLGDGSTTTDVGPLRTYTVRPITNTTYTLTAIGISGSATSTLSVTVTGADGASLVYTDPPAGSAAVRLVKDASSTATHLVLDAVLTQTASAISGLAMNLPLDGTTPGSRDGMLRVAMDDAAAASLPSGFMTVAPGFDVNTAAIPAWSGGGAPGSSHPAAALAKLPVAGPLMGVLAFGAAWKPSAACTSNSADCQGTSATAGTGTNGTVLARVRLKLVPSGGVGPVFSGTGGTGFRAELRDGTLGSLSTFAVGTLVVQ